MKTRAVTILMAVYNPNLSWLEGQLASLNAQEYAPIELLVWNDCPGERESDALIKQEIKNFPYKIYHAEKNLGSNGAFERLTELAEGDCFAYCDQDDIWHVDKLQKLVEVMEREHATLVCSDMRVIDEMGNVTADHIIEVHPHQTFVEDEGQLETLLSRNFVTGCTMLVQRDIAKKAVPFMPYMVHDHWLALWNAVYGRIAVIHDALIDYRIHGNNQSGILAGIDTKADYREKRCYAYLQKMLALSAYTFDGRVNAMIRARLLWAEARYRYLLRPGFANFWRILTNCRFDIPRSFFELALPLMPRFLFERVIQRIKEGKL